MKAIGYFLILWTFYAFGADIYQYLHTGQYYHLLISLILNVISGVYLVHTLFFPHIKKSIYHISTICILLFFYGHAVALCMLGMYIRFEDFLKVFVYGQMSFYLAYNLYVDFQTLKKS